MNQNKYFDLLKSYCDRMVENQITELKDPNFYGGLLCPSCAYIHGRIADAVYPLVAMYDYTRDAKYLECARRVVAWSEYNVKRAHGGYYNDKLSNWIAITVFSSISFGEMLLYHGACLDEATRAEWSAIHLRLTEFVRKRFVEEDFHAPVNYYASYTAAMALAYRLTGKELYRTAAYDIMARVEQKYLVTGDGLFIGEGTRNGVDLGYNVEESLPALTTFAHLMQDAHYLALCEKLWRTHLEFMIPDGGWDNTFGSRHNKWTYYGSRTSDGAATGLCYLWKKDPIFAEAIERNFEMMRACSKDGYLYGGRMYIEAGEDPCLHHSFTHAKALVAILDSGFVHGARATLPRDEAYGHRHFDDARLELVAVGDFRATVSAYDRFNAPESATSGGSLTLLWHKKLGPIFTASVVNYYTAEPYNMQRLRRTEKMVCMTPRIEYKAEKKKYMSVNACDATVRAAQIQESVRVEAEGVLQTAKYERGVPYALTYDFGERGVIITAAAEQGGELILPVICGAEGKLMLDGTKASVKRTEGTVCLSASAPISCRADEDHVFHLVGGCIASILRIPLAPHEPVRVELTVE